MAYDKNIFSVDLKKRFKPVKYKYVTVNNRFYIDGDMDLFTGLELKQIQFILFCLSLADNQIVRYKEINKVQDFHPKYIAMNINHEALYGLLGNHSKRNIELIHDLFFNESVSRKGFNSTYSKESNEFSVIIDTSIFMNNKEKNFTKVFICDIMKTKSLPSVYIKMKIYKFLNSSSYIEGIDSIDEEDYMLIYLTKDKFKLWSNCGKAISKYMKNCLLSINKENDKKILWGLKEDDSNKSSIILKVSRKEYSDHILLNGEDFQVFLAKEPPKNKTDFKYII